MSQKPQQPRRSLDDRILAVLKDLIDHHSSSRNVAEQMGQAHNYVARILRGETKLRLDVLGRILETLGISEKFFLKLVIGSGQKENAAEVLRFYGADGPPPGPFIQKVEVEVERWLAEGAFEASADGWRDQGELLAELEERRHADKEGVQEEVETLVSVWLLDPAVRCNAGFRNLAEALATWGTIRRFEGFRREVSLAYQVALRLCDSSDSPRIHGNCLRKASVLFRDLGCGEAGLALLDEATQIHMRAGQFEDCARVLADRGMALMGMSCLEAAAEEIEAALRLLPETDMRYRVSSYSNLALCYEQMGDMKRARKCLARAKQLYGNREDAMLAHIIWNQGNLAMISRDYIQAEAAYEKTLGLLIEYGKPLEVAFVALSLAEAYVGLRKLEAMRRLADQMLAWLPAIRGNRIADAAMMEWIRCAKWGEVTHRALIEAKRKLSQAAQS